MEEYKFKTTPYAHQREAFVLSAEKKVYALLMDMGTGKTKVCLDTIGHLFEKQEIDFSIIVAPNAPPGAHRKGSCSLEASPYQKIQGNSQRVKYTFSGEDEISADECGIF